MIVKKETDQIENREPTEVEKKRGPLNHHALVAEIHDPDSSSPQVTTINGNAEYQQIRKVTKPLSNYSGYYDSLSQTDYATYEKQVRGIFGPAVKAREKAGFDPV
jgi:hypothetical protein